MTVDFFFRPTSGGQEPLDSDPHSGCRTLGIKASNAEVPQDFKTGGKICAKLTVSGKPVTTSCHVVSG